LSLAVVIAMPLLAADQEKKAKKVRKKPDPAAGILKKLEKAELTEEQVAKIKTLAAATAEKTKEARAKAAFTDEQKAALKKAREEGKKGEELRKVVTLTEEQKAAVKEARNIQAAMMKEVMGLLTPEQKEKAGLRERGKKGGKKGGERKPRPKKKASE
jgi:Spy/CpxP family protein refolding chaperone